MKRYWAIWQLFAAGWLVLAGSGPVLAETPMTEAPAWSELRGELPGALSQVPAVSERQLDIFRQAPTVSGRVRVSEQTLIPFVGAGFRGGYMTDRDRALSPQTVVPQQNLLGESLGKGMMPNEFQMGIRIPF